MVRIQLSPAVSRQTMGSSAAEAARIAHSDRRRPSGRAKHGTARRQLCETCTQCHRRESLTLARTLRGRIMRIMKYLRGRIMRIMKYHRIRLALLGVCLLAPAACAPPGDVPRPQAQIPALAPGMARVWLLRDTGVCCEPILPLIARLRAPPTSASGALGVRCEREPRQRYALIKAKLRVPATRGRQSSAFARQGIRPGLRPSPSVRLHVPGRLHIIVQKIGS